MRALLLLFLLGLGVAAQERLQGPALEIRCAPAAREAGIAALNAFSEARARVRVALGLDALVPVVVELVPNQAALLARVRECGAAEPEHWVVAVALPWQGLMVLRTDQAGGALPRLRGLLAHEYAHLALGAALRAADTPPVPRWVDEGLAQVAEGRLFVEETPALHMRAFFHTLLPLSELENRFPQTEGGGALAYAQAESFVKWLGRRGEGGLPAFVQLLVHGASVDNAVRAHTGLDLQRAEERWRRELRDDRSWMLEMLLQVAFGGFVAVACVLAVARLVRRRRKLMQELERSEEMAQELPLEGEALPEAGPPELTDSPPRRRVRRFRWRTLRDDETDPPA